MVDEANTRNAVTIQRTLEAPVELVWKMWTEPEHFAAWYGPTGSTVPVATMDVRVGGTRHIGMAVHTPDGMRQMWFTGEYREVVEYRRLVYTEAMSDESGTVLSSSQTGMPEGYPATTEVVVEFEDLGAGGTRMTMTHVGVPADSPGAAGWNMAFDKLAAALDAQAPPAS